jgi:hypothetical protein
MSKSYVDPSTTNWRFPDAGIVAGSMLGASRSPESESESESVAGSVGDVASSETPSCDASASAGGAGVSSSSPPQAAQPTAIAAHDRTISEVLDVVPMGVKC